jgi:4-amino-4-deoxychorismate lyase
MCQLFETIRVKNNTLQHIAFHNNRVNDSRKHLFQIHEQWDLSEIIEIPELDPNIIYRCRFNYTRKAMGVAFVPYVPRIVRKLYLVDCANLDYSFKYSDRSALEKLKKDIPDPEISDVLLVKKGLITDTTFSNIVLFDGFHWHTPAIPLLKGTRREFYIQNKTILPCDISVSELFKYTKARLINAMLDFDEGNDIPVENLMVVG